MEREKGGIRSSDASVLIEETPNLVKISGTKHMESWVSLCAPYVVQENQSGSYRCLL